MMKSLLFWERPKTATGNDILRQPGTPGFKFLVMFKLLREAEEFNMLGDEEACKGVLEVLRNKVESYSIDPDRISEREADFCECADVFFAGKFNNPIDINEVKEALKVMSRFTDYPSIAMRRYLANWAISRGYVLNPRRPGYQSIECPDKIFNRMVKTDEYGRTREYLYIGRILSGEDMMC